MQSCKGLFSQMLEYSIKPFDLSYFDNRVVGTIAEHSLHNFLSTWTHTVVHKALFEAQNQCPALHGPFVDMVPGCCASSKKRLMPDWAGVRGSMMEGYDRPKKILPGETMASYKWKSTEVGATEVGSLYEQHWVWPIMRVFTNCISLDTRYEYIITDEEAVMFRVRARRNQNGGLGNMFSMENSTIEFVSVPYTTISSSRIGIKEKQRLTVNLALWWLHILTANDCSIQEKYPPLQEEDLRSLL
jgi:hypothetical protein